MARAKELSTKIRSWELLNENLKPHLAEMPYVQGFMTELQGLLEMVRTIDAEQEDARSRLRDLVRRRQEAERQGEIVRRRVEAHLKGSFGYTSEELIKFGVKPRPRVIRRKGGKEPLPPPEEITKKPQAV